MCSLNDRQWREAADPRGVVDGASVCGEIQLRPFTIARPLPENGRLFM
jgi:hypothetical protein